MNNREHLSVKSVKMSNQELVKKIKEFRGDERDILIATNVIEEGLDVASCKRVICLNELMTVKDFIQMKGRARQKDSTFLFLCATQQAMQMEQDRKAYMQVIQYMQDSVVNVDIKPKGKGELFY